MHPSHYRLRHALHRRAHTGHGLEQLLHEAFFRIGTHLAQVMSGTESLAGPGNKHRTRRGIA
jgi:hypothetical protein